MGSRNPSYSSEEDPDYQGEEGEEETEYEEEDEDGASDGSSEVEVLEIPGNGEHGIEGGGGGRDEEQGEESEEVDEQQEETNGLEIGGGGGGKCAGATLSGKPDGVELDGSFVPHCPVCFEPWTPDGLHRVCCIPCGHLYGRSCLEKWLQRCSKNIGKCPICNKKFKLKEIINLYAPLIAVRNDELEKELCSLREKNELLQIEKAHLLEEISKQRKHQMDREHSDGLKMACLEHASSGAIRRRLLGYFDESGSSSSQTFMDNSFHSQIYNRGGFRNCVLDLQNEVAVDCARVMGIDASSQIVLISGKRPGVLGEHILSKISLLAPYDIHKIALPPCTGAIKDLCMLPGELALLASLGKKLSLFSMGSNNLVLKYDLPVPAWSCSGDINSQYQIYAGLQNGMLLVFDIRQTARHLDSMEGLSRHPIHTIHSVAHDYCTRNVLTASSLGPCVWDISGSGERPFLIPEMEDQGVCIALACSRSMDDMVASFRPKVELPSDRTSPSQPSVSPSPLVTGAGKLGSHVLIKRINRSSFQKHEVAFGSVNEVRMSKSAIICSEGDSQPLFVHGDESSRGMCLWDLPSFRQCALLKPHRHPILDLKYARSRGPGFLGCISEDRLQVFTC